MIAAQRIPTRNEAKVSAERILTAAAQMCRRYGRSKATVADIAAELRTSTANIYRHFPSKFSILNALAARVLDNVLVSVAELVETSGSERLGEYIRQNHRRLVALMNEEPALYEMMAVADEQSWPSFEEYARSIHSNIAEIIRRGIDGREFRCQDSSRAAACVCISTTPLWRPAASRNCNASALSVGPDELIAFCIDSLRDNATDGRLSPDWVRGQKPLFPQSQSSSANLPKAPGARLESE